MSLNVRGIVNEKKRRAIFDKHRINADILILQETHSTVEVERVWESEWGGKIIYTHGDNMSKGLAVLTTKKAYDAISNIYRDLDGRVIIFDLQEQEQKITIAAIYAPNEDSPKFFQEIATELRKRSEHKIVVGDFNLVLDVELDRQNTYCNNNRAMMEVYNMCDQFYLSDVWRVQNGEKREFSWMKRQNRELKASRIDFALVSGGLDQKIKCIMYLSSICTDHRAIYMVVEITQQERGTGYWKLNTSLLQRIEYVDVINLEIDRSLKASTEKGAIQRWEILKKRIKQASIKFSKEKNSQDKIIIAQLSEKVNDYESRLPLPREEDEMLEKTKQELEDKTLERAQGIIFRSKAKWYEEGEKSTEYFFSLEKAKYNAKTCYKMIDKEGLEIIQPDKILELQKEYYQDLYSKDDFVHFTLENKSNIKVPDKVKENQDIQITIQEYEQAIKAMNNKKTPGQDGIPIDFYKVFWKKLQEPFYAMSIECYNQKRMHDSARAGILNLIPKSGKDARYVKNLRPITLLNTDYKIIEKAIANKMIPALETIIQKDQRGFMKERRISVNIRKMLDIIQQARVEDLEAVILSLDFVKCFDKCSFAILHGSLDFFGFGEIVKEWTKILYSDFKVKVQNNGFFSEEIPIMKGVHQGGCCSSVYFLVIAEILAMAIRANEEIEGITIQDIRNILNQFADDMDIFSICTEKSVRAIFSELEAFRLQSGFTVSYDKTTLYRIGSLRHADAQRYNMDEYVWSNQDINVLGVTIAHEDLVQKNYIPLLTKVTNTLSQWQNRGLSLIGKIQVVNTLVASLFVYKMMVLPVIPKSVVKTYDNIVRQFIWNNKKAKIAYNILQLPKQEGGLNLVNLEKKDTALKATWPQILLKEEQYSKLVYGLMRCKVLGQDIWRCSIHPQDVGKIKIKEVFWEDVLKSWSQFNYYQPLRIENQLIWYNSRIKVAGKIVVWNDVYLRGLKYVYQLFSGMEYKSDQQVEQEFGLTKLRFNSLKVAIPKEWKQFFITTDPRRYHPIPPHTYDVCGITGKSLSSKVYKFISEDSIYIHSKYIKWRMEVGNDFCESFIDFRDAHRDIYKVTNVPKYRSFQYRLLQRGLVTNIQLFKWDIKESENCYFCGRDRETISHLLFLCPIVKELWDQVFMFIREKYQVKLEVSTSTVLLNTVYDRKNHVVNFMCLVTKQYIYSQRCLNKQLNFAELKGKFRNLQNIEKYIAIKNQRLLAHEKKWDEKGVNDRRAEISSSISQFIESYVQQM